jgi:hypothetical protein
MMAALPEEAEPNAFEWAHQGMLVGLDSCLRLVASF